MVVLIDDDGMPSSSPIVPLIVSVVSSSEDIIGSLAASSALVPSDVCVVADVVVSSTLT